MWGKKWEALSTLALPRQGEVRRGKWGRVGVIWGGKGTGGTYREGRRVGGTGQCREEEASC